MCLGDTFDRRKYVNFNSLEAARKMWFDPLAECGIHMSMLVGNHDIVGGGTSGWMTAAAFCKTFPKWDITMVSSGDPINVGSDRLPR